MVNIRIYTKKFIPQLKTWTISTNTQHRLIESYGEGICVAEIEIQDFKADDLVDLFEEITISINAVVNDSKPLTNAVKKSMSKYRSIITEQLIEYFEIYSDMSVEGFIYFRLWEYSHIINVLLYARMKKELASYKYLIT